MDSNGTIGAPCWLRLRQLGHSLCRTPLHIAKWRAFNPFIAAARVEFVHSRAHVLVDGLDIGDLPSATFSCRTAAIVAVAANRCRRRARR